ncbi:RNA polymerase sigma factor [Kangiella sediminilitoris]|uniref:RNA polymerase, sigma-24 subunit, ECF subfamily n=1 Tax=Kangiella sediminilitoris TaxID=1144748 RepID=A0A1B3BD33_9GAMM|nr:RNA polymerase sigma factor [Kangiella sediminilitoris]AOE50729.1 RNA polymerase, sigma-24 subunit, ECF subfamily [Kangiella sediminilitoris]
MSQVSLQLDAPFLEELGRKSLVFALQLLGNQSEAEDVVQASIEKVLSHPKAPKGGVDLQKWLYRVVRNASIDRIRQQSRETSLDETGALLEPSDSISPEVQLEREQIRQRLRSALQTLPVHHRELVVLRDYHGHSYDDIAEILSVPKGTVMSRLHRARLALREALSDKSKDTSFETR